MPNFANFSKIRNHRRAELGTSLIPGNVFLRNGFFLKKKIRRPSKTRPLKKGAKGTLLCPDGSHTKLASVEKLTSVWKTSNAMPNATK